MYQSQILAPTPGVFVFSRNFVVYISFQYFFFSECLFLKKHAEPLLVFNAAARLQRAAPFA